MKKLFFSMMFVAAFLITACSDKDEAGNDVKGVELNKTTMSLLPGETETLVCTVEPAGADNKDVKWSSGDNNLATVDDNGLVTAVAPGMVIITVTTLDGSYKAYCRVTVVDVTVPVTGVELDETELTIEQNQKFQITASITPADATFKGVTWTLSNSVICAITPRDPEDDDWATVTLEALLPGELTITVMTRDGYFTKNCVVTIDEVFIPVTGITVSSPSLTLEQGQSEVLTATIAPDNATNKNFTWTSSDDRVATVDPATGEITAVAPGAANIIVTSEDGTYTGTCNLTVTKQKVNLNVGDDLKAAMENSENSGKIIFLPVGYTFTITEGITPAPDITVMGDPAGARPIILSTLGSTINLPTAAEVDEPGELNFVYLDIDRQAGGGAIMFNRDASVVATKISFTECLLTGFGRNLLRFRQASVIGEIIIDDCILTNMSPEPNYGMIHIEGTAGSAAPSEVKSITLKNSTFNGNASHVILFQNDITRASGCETILIENCTFFDILESNRNFIHTGQMTATAITLKNLILGSTRQTVSNVFVSSATNVTVDNVYITNSWVVTGSDVPNTILYDGGATDLFVNPDAGDFKIKDAAFAGRGNAGDPRWW